MIPNVESGSDATGPGHGGSAVRARKGHTAMLSTLIANVAFGSATATPTVGSAAVDYVTRLPAFAILALAGLLGAIGS